MSTITVFGTSIILWCCVRGSTSTFEINIERGISVSNLKEAIKAERKPRFDQFASDELKLLKLKNPVDYGHISDIRNFTLQGNEEEDNNVVLMKDMESIGDYWPEDEEGPPDARIHVIVEAPGLSPADAISKAERLFDFYSQDLVNVAKNAYEPYSYFEAPEKNCYKKFIDDKKIPVVNNEPNLLLHNLPERGEKGLTNYESFEDHIRKKLPHSNKTVIMGTSGCGKTRLCFEALCQNYGLYLVALPCSVGSIDLEESARWTEAKIKDKQPKEAESIAERAVMSCIVGRMLLLKHLFNVAGQHNTIMMPKSWLILQLSHIIIRKLYLIFRGVEGLNSVCESILLDIVDKLTNIFPIVYDEAQSHTAFLPETFPSVQLNKDRARPFFSVVVRSLSTLSNTFVGAFVCITGSGLSLLREIDEISTRAKDESRIPTFIQFGRINTSDELLKLATRIFPLEEKHALHAIKWLKGRYRWSWIWIYHLITSEHFDPEKQLKELVTRLTTSADSVPEEYSIYASFVNLQKYPSPLSPQI